MVNLFARHLSSWVSLVALVGLLSGCAATVQPHITAKKTAQIAAANRQSEATVNAQAQDTSAAKRTGKQYTAANDHITSATSAAAAVKQVLANPRQRLFQPVPAISTDAQGHHYYQVDAYVLTATGQRGHRLQSYFVYPNGVITTKQAD
ncbi:hypothetical protein C5Z26_01180 [Lactobacillus sp. CBA3606]|nr:hypothetical protein C5Z26_01180 [Lactobacillus sp. CBA3606]